MIRKKTVLVVGAGGSCSYDFPSGAGLLWDARSTSVQTLREITRNYYPDRIVGEFLAALTECESDSLDNLLEFRADADHIARLYMASRILRAEDNARRAFKDQSDWLGYLFQKMDARWPERTDFGQNAVTFVTYNYDRLIEHRISQGLRARYRHTDSQVEENIEQFWVNHPVLHLHGSTGEFGRKIIPYGARTSDRENIEDAIANVIERASNGIQVVHQVDGNSTAFQAARKALSEAERVVFLGFSFGETNVDRLDLSAIAANATCICSRKGMTDAEVRLMIEEPFKRSNVKHERKFGGTNDDCRATLREYVDLLFERY